MFRFVFLFLFLVFGSSAFAYPTSIGFGYTNCMTCHYNPMGHGQLNDYGRALFASEIAAKPFWKPEATDEELAQKSGFFFDEPVPRTIRPAFKFRELYMTTSLVAAMLLKDTSCKGISEPPFISMKMISTF